MSDRSSSDEHLVARVVVGVIFNIVLVAMLTWAAGTVIDDQKPDLAIGLSLVLLLWLLGAGVGLVSRLPRAEATPAGAAAFTAAGLSTSLLVATSRLDHGAVFVMGVAVLSPLLGWLTTTAVRSELLDRRTPHDG